MTSVPVGSLHCVMYHQIRRPDLEDPERIRERIKEAAQYVPLSRLSLSPQCGFASTEIGNKLTEEDQWKKIALVRDIAQTVWG